MKNKFLKGNLSPGCAMDSVEYKRNFKAAHLEYFDPDGLLVFTGVQGSGKTLSAVQYCRKVIERYPDCIFCTNVDIKDLPPCKEIVPYDGLNCLMNLENGYAGVLYLIDEIHLEFNSLESKNISIEEMTEFAQQRKQRKHIVGTSQLFMRVAKPLREQVKRIVMCQCKWGLLQINTEIDGTTARETPEGLDADILGTYMFWHTPDLYACYDTYAKMKRYKGEWNGHASQTAALVDGGARSPYKLGPRRSGGAHK